MGGVAHSDTTVQSFITDFPLSNILHFPGTTNSCYTVTAIHLENLRSHTLYILYTEHSFFYYLDLKKNPTRKTLVQFTEESYGVFMFL